MPWKPTQGPISEEIASPNLAAIPNSFGSNTKSQKTALDADWSNSTPRDLRCTSINGTSHLLEEFPWVYRKKGKLLATSHLLAWDEELLNWPDCDD